MKQISTLQLFLMLAPTWTASSGADFSKIKRTKISRSPKSHEHHRASTTLVDLLQASRLLRASSEPHQYSTRGLVPQVHGGDIYADDGAPSAPSAEDERLVRPFFLLPTLSASSLSAMVSLHQDILVHSRRGFFAQARYPSFLPH